MKTHAILLVIIGVAACCYAYPQPAGVQGANEWTLTVEYDQPRQISVVMPGESIPQRFWYIILTLKNVTSMEVPFYPQAEIVTDTFQVVPSGIPGSKLIFDKIKLLHQGKYPFLECIDFVDSAILQGQDNAVDLVIIWPDFDLQAKHVKLMISGLSNETAIVDHPTLVEQDGSPVRFYLRKTLSLEYTISGDPKFRNSQELKFEDQNWIMR